MTDGPNVTEAMRALVLKSPDAVSGLVRSGGASMSDLRVNDRLEKMTGVSLDKWLEQLTALEQEQFVRRLGNLLVVLDELEELPADAGAWPPSMSEERRDFVFGQLGLPGAIPAEIRRRNPLPAAAHASPLVWVDPNIRPGHSQEFTGRTKGPRWQRYRLHLEERMGWPGRDIAFMERDLDELVTAFPDPQALQRSPRRLLVVGFTQSGKTANFLGLGARMADAGTRLVIILSGRTKILRRQTQARIDRDLIGADPVNLGLLEQEYSAGHRLLDRLAKPGPAGVDVGWTRLTQVGYGRAVGASGTRAQSDDDAYPRPQGGLASKEHSRPMIAVLKKTPGDLETFKSALAAAPAAFRRLPAVVIDEEADDASLNYRAKKASGGGWAPVVGDDERSTVNRLISEMLGLLEGSVYVGYTATPFANCFADADDEAGFFPHGIQVLQTPDGYFGASRVFNALYDGPPGSLLPTAAHVREIQSGHDEHAKLDDALDDYLIAGGIKLFRMERALNLGDDRARQRLRHHTMMVHIGTTRDAQRSIQMETRDRLFNRAGRGLGVMSPSASAARLKNRFERDFRLVSLSLTAVPGRLPTRELDQGWVPTWEELQPHLIRAVEHLIELNRSESVVLRVNSDADRETPEYDADASDLGRWCVLVGGLMLSRGFTVEGLSTVYFRRTASAMDTQLQLARWNGYRSYFEDLIRIYFGVAELGTGNKPPRNLLAEFAASTIRDAQFREKLRRYGEDGTSPRLELPTFLDEKGASALRLTAAPRMRGVIRQTGAPIEFGRRGLGLGAGNLWLADIATEVEDLSFATVVVCAECGAKGRSETMRLATAMVPAEAVRRLLEAIVAGGAPPQGREDKQSIEDALTVDPWRVVLIGMSREPDDGYAPLGRLKVPVRRRTVTDYDTLSTGQWNRWMRVAVGDGCVWCGSKQESDPRPIVALLPYVTESASEAGVRWGCWRPRCLVMIRQDWAET